jgi:hypothetical protein
MTGSRYLPVLISRIMLSLRKAAATQQQHGQTLGLPSADDANIQSAKLPLTGPSRKGEDIQLDTFLDM